MAPTEENTRWKVGFIQASSHMTDYRIYGNEGVFSCEIPGQMSGKETMIIDCLNNNDMWPWYTHEEGVVTFTGPSKLNQMATIHVADAPWSREGLRYTHTTDHAYLTRMTRDHSFYTWLVAWDQTADKAYIMKTIKWSLHWNVDVDPNKPQGERARLVSDPVPRQPEILADDVPIPLCAMIPPSFNQSNELVWHPTSGEAVCIRRPPWKEAKYIQMWAKRVLDLNTLTQILPKGVYNLKNKTPGKTLNRSTPEDVLN